MIEFLPRRRRPYLEQREGWMSEEELDYLYERTYELTKNGGLALNIGCYKGLSCSALALACPEVYCVDIFEPTKSTPEVDAGSTAGEWFKNMQRLGLRERIRLFVLPSRAALSMFQRADLTFRLIFIDASHEYEDVRDDILSSMAILSPIGGEIVLDDYVGNHPGIKKAADEIGGFQRVEGTKMAFRRF